MIHHLLIYKFLQQVREIMFWI